MHNLTSFIGVVAASAIAALVMAVADTNLYIPLWIALIVAIPSTFTPLAMAWFQQRARVKEKKLDWERQDNVAAKVEAVRKANAEVAIKVQEVKDASDNRTVQLDALAKGQEVIHSLVDGQLTAALQSELDSKMIAVALMKEVLEMRKHENGEPSAESLAIIRSMEDSINDLKKRLEARRAIEARMKEKDDQK